MPLDVELLGTGVLGIAEGLLHIPCGHSEVAGHVSVVLFVQQRLVAQRLVGIGDGGQGLISDFYEVHGILG